MVDFKDRYRNARVVLVDSHGTIFGALPPIKLTTPWLQEVGELIQRVHELHDVDVTILRLLSTDETRHAIAIDVEYLAEIAGRPAIALAPWNAELTDEPLRLSYAKPGGPLQELDWALGLLVREGLGPIVSKTQVRTWNLSSIWKLQSENGAFWLKSVPPFFAHEGAVLELLAGEAVPPIVGSDRQRILLEHFPGEDLYDASIEDMRRMVDTLVDLQWRWRDRLDELTAAGTPDMTSAVLAHRISSAIDRNLDEFGKSDQARLLSFAANLTTQLNELDACGFPRTLVHGDYHPGNWRGAGSNLIILDWGDCFIGHPLLDLPALLDRAGSHTAEVRAHWINAWQRRLPDADMETALSLVMPIARARLAAVFQLILDNIEPAERVFHEADPVNCLREVCKMLDGASFVQE